MCNYNGMYSGYHTCYKYICCPVNMQQQNMTQGSFCPAPNDNGECRKPQFCNCESKLPPKRNKKNSGMPRDLNANVPNIQDYGETAYATPPENNLNQNEMDVNFDVPNQSTHRTKHQVPVKKPAIIPEPKTTGSRRNVTLSVTPPEENYVPYTEPEKVSSKRRNPSPSNSPIKERIAGSQRSSTTPEPRNPAPSNSPIKERIVGSQRSSTTPEPRNPAPSNSPVKERIAVSQRSSTSTTPEARNPSPVKDKSPGSQRSTTSTTPEPETFSPVAKNSQPKTPKKTNPSPSMDYVKNEINYPIESHRAFTPRTAQEDRSPTAEDVPKTPINKSSTSTSRPKREEQLEDRISFTRQVSKESFRNQEFEENFTVSVTREKSPADVSVNQSIRETEIKKFNFLPPNDTKFKRSFIQSSNSNGQERRDMPSPERRLYNDAIVPKDSKQYYENDIRRRTDNTYKTDDYRKNYYYPAQSDLRPKRDVDQLITPYSTSSSACSCYQSTRTLYRAKIEPQGRLMNCRCERGIPSPRMSNSCRRPSATPPKEEQKSLIRAKVKVVKRKRLPPRRPPVKGEQRENNLGQITNDNIWFECNLPIRVNIPTSFCLQNLFGFSPFSAVDATGKSLVKAGSKATPFEGTSGNFGFPSKFCISVAPAFAAQQQGVQLPQQLPPAERQISAIKGKGKKNNKKRKKALPSTMNSSYSPCEISTQTSTTTPGVPEPDSCYSNVIYTQCKLLQNCMEVITKQLTISGEKPPQLDKAETKKEAKPTRPSKPTKSMPNYTKNDRVKIQVAGSDTYSDLDEFDEEDNYVEMEKESRKKYYYEKPAREEKDTRKEYFNENLSKLKKENDKENYYANPSKFLTCRSNFKCIHKKDNAKVNSRRVYIDDELKGNSINSDDTYSTSRNNVGLPSSHKFPDVPPNSFISGLSNKTSSQRECLSVDCKNENTIGRTMPETIVPRNSVVSSIKSNKFETDMNQNYVGQNPMMRCYCQNGGCNQMPHTGGHFIQPTDIPSEYAPSEAPGNQWRYNSGNQRCCCCQPGIRKICVLPLPYRNYPQHWKVQPNNPIPYNQQNLTNPNTVGPFAQTLPNFASPVQQAQADNWPEQCRECCLGYSATGETTNNYQQPMENSNIEPNTRSNALPSYSPVNEEEAAMQRQSQDKTWKETCCKCSLETNASNLNQKPFGRNFISERDDSIFPQDTTSECYEPSIASEKMLQSDGVCREKSQVHFNSDERVLKKCSLNRNNSTTSSTNLQVKKKPSQVSQTKSKACNCKSSQRKCSVLRNITCPEELISSISRPVQKLAAMSINESPFTALNSKSQRSVSRTSADVLSNHRCACRNRNLRNSESKSAKSVPQQFQDNDLPRETWAEKCRQCCNDRFARISLQQYERPIESLNALELVACACAKTKRRYNDILRDGTEINRREQRRVEGPEVELYGNYNRYNWVNGGEEERAKEKSSQIVKQKESQMSHGKTTEESNLKRGSKGKARSQRQEEPQDSNERNDDQSDREKGERVHGPILKHERHPSASKRSVHQSVRLTSPREKENSPEPRQEKPQISIERNLEQNLRQREMRGNGHIPRQENLQSANEQSIQEREPRGNSRRPRQEDSQSSNESGLEDNLHHRDPREIGYIRRQEHTYQRTIQHEIHERGAKGHDQRLTQDWQVANVKTLGQNTQKTSQRENAQTPRYSCTRRSRNQRVRQGETTGEETNRESSDADYVRPSQSFAMCCYTNARKQQINLKLLKQIINESALERKTDPLCVKQPPESNEKSKSPTTNDKLQYNHGKKKLVVPKPKMRSQSAPPSNKRKKRCQCSKENPFIIRKTKSDVIVQRGKFKKPSKKPIQQKEPQEYHCPPTSPISAVKVQVPQGDDCECNCPCDYDCNIDCDEPPPNALRDLYELSEGPPRCVSPHPAQKGGTEMPQPSESEILCTCPKPKRQLESTKVKMISVSSLDDESILNDQDSLKRQPLVCVPFRLDRQSSDKLAATCEPDKLRKLQQSKSPCLQKRAQNSKAATTRGNINCAYGALPKQSDPKRNISGKSSTNAQELKKINSFHQIEIGPHSASRDARKDSELPGTSKSPRIQFQADAETHGNDLTKASSQRLNQTAVKSSQEVSPRSNTKGKPHCRTDCKGKNMQQLYREMVKDKETVTIMQPRRMRSDNSVKFATSVVESTVPSENQERLPPLSLPKRSTQSSIYSSASSTLSRNHGSAAVHSNPVQQTMEAKSVLIETTCTCNMEQMLQTLARPPGNFTRSHYPGAPNASQENHQQMLQQQQKLWEQHQLMQRQQQLLKQYQPPRLESNNVDYISECMDCTSWVDPRNVRRPMGPLQPPQTSVSQMSSYQHAQEYHQQYISSYPSDQFNGNGNLSHQCHQNTQPTLLEDSLKMISPSFYQQTMEKYGIEHIDSNFRPPHISVECFQPQQQPQMQAQMQGTSHPCGSPGNPCVFPQQPAVYNFPQPVYKQFDNTYTESSSI